MTTISSNTKPQKWRKLAFQLTFGGVIGALSGYFGVGLFKDNALATDQLAVIAIGTVYLLMGLILAFGLAVPKLGANILNVEDAQEIQDQRRILTGSAICMAVLGAAFIALPLAGPAGPISPIAAFCGLLTALLVLIVISIRDWYQYDEMMWQLSRDAGNYAFCGIGTLLLGWASGAWLDLFSAPSPLSLVAVVTGGFLVAIFAATAKRGLLAPR